MHVMPLRLLLFIAQGLRQLCTDNGALLCFDEVMTGFRIAKGCAQEHFGITPDLTTVRCLHLSINPPKYHWCCVLTPGPWCGSPCSAFKHFTSSCCISTMRPAQDLDGRCSCVAWPPTNRCRATGRCRRLGLTWPCCVQLGKVIGGGLPVGAYGGRREIMQMVAPAGEPLGPHKNFSSIQQMSSTGCMLSRLPGAGLMCSQGMPVLVHDLLHASGCVVSGAALLQVPCTRQAHCQATPWP